MTDPVDPQAMGEPKTAEELMRSRFAAFRRGDGAWLLRTWHPTTRPRTLDLSDNPRWRGLQIVHVIDGGDDDDTGEVEFRATFLVEGGGVDILHERITGSAAPRGPVVPLFRPRHPRGYGIPLSRLHLPR